MLQGYEQEQLQRRQRRLRAMGPDSAPEPEPEINATEKLLDASQADVDTQEGEEQEEEKVGAGKKTWEVVRSEQRERVLLERREMAQAKHNGLMQSIKREDEMLGVLAMYNQQQEDALSTVHRHGPALEVNRWRPRRNQQQPIEDDASISPLMMQGSTFTQRKPTQVPSCLRFGLSSFRVLSSVSPHGPMSRRS